MQEGLGHGARAWGAVRDLVEGSGPGEAAAARQKLRAKDQRNGSEDPPLQNPSLQGVILLK
jgi:hypothetical protein